MQNKNDWIFIYYRVIMGFFNRYSIFLKIWLSWNCFSKKMNRKLLVIFQNLFRNPQKSKLEHKKGIMNIFIRNVKQIKTKAIWIFYFPKCNRVCSIEIVLHLISRYFMLCWCMLEFVIRIFLWFWYSNSKVLKVD